MNRFWRISIVLVSLLSASVAVATEEAKYDVLYTVDDIEIRHYDSQLVAEIIINADIEQAGNKAFRPLFDYISGNNRSQAEIAMTAPVSQQAIGEEIAMTAPVSQRQSDSGWAVSFTMPASYTMSTLPKPKDDRIKLRQVPEQIMAVIRYSGFWSESRYIVHKLKLQSWLYQSDYKANGPAIWARYNAPFTLWFFRRNEVLIPVVKQNPD